MRPENTLIKYSIDPFFSLPLVLIWVTGELKRTPGEFGQSQTQDRYTKTPKIIILYGNGNVCFLECGRTPENSDEPHARTSRTCKFHKRGPEPKFEPRDHEL